MGEQEPETQYTEEQLKELADFVTKSGAAPTEQDKYNVHLFLHRVATSDDTTKTGNLDVIELGKPKYPERSLKEMSLISSDIIDNEDLSKYFTKEAEILTATSLSKDGFLIKQATTTTRQIADVTRKKTTSNKSWFKKKEPTEAEGATTQ